MLTWPSSFPFSECFIDIHEEIDAIISKSGSAISAESRGTIHCRCYLSGMPDLTLSFMNSRLMDDVALHPCVRLAPWTTQGIMSFVPPVSFIRKRGRRKKTKGSSFMAQYCRLVHLIISTRMASSSWPSTRLSTSRTCQSLSAPPSSSLKWVAADLSSMSSQNMDKRWKVSCVGGEKERAHSPQDDWPLLTLRCFFFSSRRPGDHSYHAQASKQRQCKSQRGPLVL